MKFSEWLKREGACGKGRTWVGGMSFERFWQTCDRPGWMFWVLANIQGGYYWNMHNEWQLRKDYDRRYNVRKSCSLDGSRPSSAAAQDYVHSPKSVARCNWLRKQVELPKRMRFK